MSCFLFCVPSGLEEALASGRTLMLIQDGPCPAPQLCRIMCYGCMKSEEYVTPFGEEMENERWANRSQQGPFRYSNHADLKGPSLRATKCAWLSEFGGYLWSSH